MTTTDPQPRNLDSAPVPRPRRIPSERLMDGRREIIIEHGPDEYRLRITSSGKLLLTK
jgi:hemin uptake protein HemP